MFDLGDRGAYGDKRKGAERTIFCGFKPVASPDSLWLTRESPPGILVPPSPRLVIIAEPRIAEMRHQGASAGISHQDLAQDRAFWRDLLAERARSPGLPVHSAGGYRNRRFAIVRDAAWITLYRAKRPCPQIGVFLRCTGLAGEAFFTLANQARADIEPLLLAEAGTDAALKWGVSHHPGMTDIASIREAKLPWNDEAAGQHRAWLLGVGAAWWQCFSSLAGDPA